MGRVYLTYLGNSMELPEGETIVGRSLACRMRFNDAAVSRQHAAIRVEGGRVTVYDLESRNGTLVNGGRLTEPTVVGNGDELTLGNRRIRILITDTADVEFDEVPTETHAAPGELARSRATTAGVEDPDAFAVGSSSHWAAGSRAAAERRRHPRHPVELPILYTSANLTVESMSLDLSRSGVFVQTAYLDEIGTDCRLTVMVDGESSLEVPGRVCRVVESESDAQPLGLGIEFRDMSSTVRRWLDDTLERLGAA